MYAYGVGKAVNDQISIISEIINDISPPPWRNKDDIFQ